MFKTIIMLFSGIADLLEILIEWLNLLQLCTSFIFKKDIYYLYLNTKHDLFSENNNR